MIRNYENYRSPSAEKLKADFHQVEYEHVASWNEGARRGMMTVIDKPDGSHLYLDNDLNKQDKDYLSDKFWKQRWSRWLEASQYWLLGIFLPPIVLFIVGWSLLWVGRGFKTAK